MSGSYCPKDLKPCPDDVCRGSGSCLEIDAPLLKKCPRCGALFDDEVLFCECPPDDWIPDDDDDDDGQASTAPASEGP